MEDNNNNTVDCSSKITHVDLDNGDVDNDHDGVDILSAFISGNSFNFFCLGLWSHRFSATIESFFVCVDFESLRNL